MEKITSFDASDGRNPGDMLSRGKKNHPVKIGLLGCGYFEYWRMYPELKAKVEKDLGKIYKRLSKDFDTVYPGMVDTLDRAEEAGRTFAGEGVELLVIVEGTYLPDFITLQAIEHVRGVPVIFFNTQTGENVSPCDNYQATMRNSALIGISQLTGTYRKMGGEYRIVVGEIDDGDAYLKTAALIRSFEISRRLRSYTVGIIGHVFRGMFDLEYDKAAIKGSLGPEVVTMQMEHLINIWRKIPTKEAEKEVERLFNRFTVKNITRDDAVSSCRLGLAMRKLVSRYRLDALCFLGQHYIEKTMGAPARIGASMLLEKDRIMVACEGDVGGLVMMQIMHDITGNIPLQAEWGQFDIKHNAVFLLGHGVASPELSKGAEEVVLTRSPEEWGFEGNGMNYQFILKPGPVTMAHFISLPGGMRMFISEGESIDFPCLPCDEIHAMVHVEQPVREYLTEVLKHGVAHHLIVVHGHIAGKLAEVADWMKIDKLII